MSVFITCETCSEVAEYACSCSNPPHFVCNSHFNYHVTSPGNHSIQRAAEPLSPEEVYDLRVAFRVYKFSSVRNAILEKSSRIKHLLEEIRRAEEDYYETIDKILNEQANKIVEICSRQAIPVYSESSLVQSLLKLKQSQNFFQQSIRDSLSTLTTPSVSHSSSNTSIRPLVQYDPRNSLQIGGKTISIEELPSQTYMPHNDPQWELFKQVPAHNEWIISVAVSDCQSYVAAASQDKTVTVWELRTLKLVRTLVGHNHWVSLVAFLDNRNKIVSASMDKTVKIWDRSRCIDTLQIFLDGVSCVCVSASKTLIASGSKEGKIVVYSYRERQTLHDLKGHEDWVLSIVFSKNDTRLVTGSLDKSIRIWSARSGQLLRTLNAHFEGVNYVNTSGMFLLSSSFDKSVKVWEWKSNSPRFSFNGHEDYVSAVDAWGHLVASLGRDDKLIVWDARSGRKIQVLKGHGTESFFLDLKFVQGGQFIVSGGHDRNIKLFRRIN